MLSEILISFWSVKRRYQNQNLRFISDDKVKTATEKVEIFFLTVFMRKELKMVELRLIKGICG